MGEPEGREDVVTRSVNFGGASFRRPDVSLIAFISWTSGVRLSAHHPTRSTDGSYLYAYKFRDYRQIVGRNKPRNRSIYTNSVCVVMSVLQNWLI